MHKPQIQSQELNEESFAQKLVENLSATFSPKDAFDVYDQLDETLMILATESTLPQEELARIYFTVRSIRDAFINSTN